MIRLERVALLLAGFFLALIEISLRKELDLPLVEATLAIWGLGELLGRRLRLEIGRTPALYLLGACCAVLGAWMVGADAMNSQAPVTTVRNILKYVILFLIVAWIAFSPSKARVAVLLLGSVLGSTAVGFSVLLANPETPYLAKYHTPYVGLLLLAAWSAGQPFDGAWRCLTHASVLAVTILAISASARWSIISTIVIAATALLPRPSTRAFRLAVLIACTLPLVPLLLLDAEAALALLAERDLHSAADVERVVLYAFAHDVILREPLFGIGFETFLDAFESSFGHLLTMTSSVQGPHNQYAAVGALFGIPALLSYAAAVGSAAFLLRPSGRRPSRLTLACALMWSFMFLANEISDDARLGLYLVAALLAGGEPATRSWLSALLLRRQGYHTVLRAKPA